MAITPSLPYKCKTDQVSPEAWPRIRATLQAWHVQGWANVYRDRGTKSTPLDLIDIGQLTDAEFVQNCHIEVWKPALARQLAGPDARILL